MVSSCRCRRADGQIKNRPAIMRLGFLAVLHATSLLGAIGCVQQARHTRLLERLSNHLRPTAVGSGATPARR
ncbi:MAG: hypothetical protein H6Q33_5277 [Deltaproteobacteria bacterium]|nr:hypothetical protein [Deltaproteobacteria bacterium]